MVKANKEGGPNDATDDARHEMRQTDAPVQDSLHHAKAGRKHANSVPFAETLAQRGSFPEHLGRPCSQGSWHLEARGEGATR